MIDYAAAMAVTRSIPTRISIILDEHYAGPARTKTDPSSTNQPSSQGSPGFGVTGALLGILLAVVYRAGRA